MNELFKLTKFKLAIYIISILAMLVATVVALTTKGGGTTKDPNALPKITVWSTIDAQQFSILNTNTARVVEQKLSVDYKQYSSQNMYNSYLEAVAAGKSPDALIIPLSDIYQYGGKLLTIPESSYPIRDYKNTYVQGADVLITPEGYLGIPMFVDPLVLYYNKTILENEQISFPPKLWSGFFDFARTFTRRGNDSITLTRSGVALGESNNISHFDDILSALYLQTYGPLTLQDQLGRISSSLTVQDGIQAIIKAVDFYTQFSDPLKTHYSWNRAQKNDIDMFVAEQLVAYFGRASEYKNISFKNPNLNFDVVEIPQPTENPAQKVGYGALYVLVIPKTAKQSATALTAAYTWSGAVQSQYWADHDNFIYQPIRRDILAQKTGAITTRSELPVFRRSAFMFRDWIQPYATKTRSAFAELISSVTSGNMDSQGAAQRLSSVISALFNQ